MSFDSVMGKTIYPVKSIAVGCDFISGYAFKGKDFTDADGHPIIKIKNIQDGKVTIKESQFIPKHLTGKKLEKFKLENGDILIAMTGQGSVGRVGKLYISTTETPYLNQRVGKFLVDEENLNKEYLYYVLSCKAYENYLFAAGSGSGQPNLSPALIKAVEIPYPPYKSQCYIGKILSDLDEKIHLNNQINQTLESIAQTIFKSWFIDFEPVRAKIIAKQEGKDTELAAMCAISGKSEVELQQMAEDDFAELQATAALFPDEFVDSELGEIPKGWEVNSLGNICNFTPGSAFKPEYQGQTQGEIPFIKVSDMNLNGNEIFIVKANNYIDNSLQKERKFKLHEEGATVFAKIGVALISNRRRVLTMPTIIDNNMMSASPLKGLSTPYYLYLLLKTIDFNTLVSGTALPYLNVSDLRKILIVHPTINLLNKFELIANPLLQKIKLNSVQCEGLVTLRDNLLPKLLSGEIDASVLNGEHG